MEFITSGDRIATENFSIGKVYTVTFTNGNYFINSCVGIGPDFVMFQQEAPKMLFCLDMESAETVSSIDESGGGAGTTNYNELDNKPSINGVTLVGNKTAADLSILPVPIVGENDNNKILTASYSGGVGSYSWQPAPSSGTTDYTQLTNKPQINSVELNGNKSLADLGIASADALAGKQDVISDLSTIRSGAAAGATAVQPATLANYQPLIDSSHKLAPALVATDTNNRFATDTQLNQIETNKTNISLLEQLNGAKNYAQLSYTGGIVNNVTYTVSNGIISTNGNTTNASTNIVITGEIPLAAGDYVLMDGLTTSSAQINLTLRINNVWKGTTATGGKYEFTVVQGDTVHIELIVANNTSTAGVVFKPMIISKAVYDAGFTDFQPYTMSLSDITAWILSQS